MIQLMTMTTKVRTRKMKQLLEKHAGKGFVGATRMSYQQRRLFTSTAFMMTGAWYLISKLCMTKYMHAW